MMSANTPKQAELNAAAVMRSWGYLDAVSPMHGADGGIDVRSSKALAQVKFRGVKAGRPEIQNLYGAAAGDSSKALMFFDFKGYSPQAVEYANQMSIGLYVYDASGAVWSVNAAGRRLMGVSLGVRVWTTLARPEIRVIGLLTAGLLLAVSLMAAVGG